MRIDSLHIEGFGVFSDARLEYLSPRLTVFCGPNESGKSTLLAFIRFMLFGLPDKRSKANRYPPLRAGIAHGGQIVVCDATGRYCLERHDGLQILMPDGRSGNEADLKDLLGGITRETFNSIFGFSLHELQQLDDAFDDGAVRDALYGAAAGLNHQLLVAGEQYLDESLTQLFKPRSKKATINTALGVLEDVHQEIRNAENDLAAFDQLHGEVTSLEQLVQGAQERQRELNAELARVKELSGWFERRRKLISDIRALSAELDQFLLSRSQLHPDLPLLNVADDIRVLLKGRDHTVALRKQRPEVQQTIAALRRDLAESIAILGPEWVQDRIETFVPPLATVDEVAAQEVDLRQVELQLAEARATERTRTEEQKVAFEAEKQASSEFEGAATPLPAPDVVLFERLVSGRGDYERTTRDLRAREGEVRAAEEEFRRSLSEINPRWIEEDLQGFDTSLPARQEVERFRDRLAEAAKALERSSEQVAQAEAAARNSEERRRQALERYASAPQAPSDDPALLVEWREMHRKMSLRWSVMQRASSPQWLPQAIALAGAATGVALWFLQPVLGVLVAFGSLAVSAWLWRRGRARRRVREALQKEFAVLCTKIGLNGSPGDDSIIEVARGLDAAGEALRQRQSLNDQLQQATKDEADAHQTVTRGREAVSNAETAVRQRTDDWRRHLEAMGLSSSLSPEGAIGIISRIELCRARFESVRTLRHRIQAMERNRLEYLAVFNDLLVARGQPPATHADLSVRLSQFLEGVRKEDDLRELKQRARERWMRASEDRRRAEDSLLQAARTHQHANDSQQQAADAWRGWLDRNSLPSHLSPAAARDFVQAVNRARGSISRLRVVEQQLQGIVEHETSFAERLNRALASAGRRSLGERVVDLDSLEAALQSAERDSQQAALLDAKIVERERQIGAIRAELEEVEQQTGQSCSSAPEVDLDARPEDLGRKLEEQEAELQELHGRLSECRSRRKAMATDERLTQLHEQKQTRIEEIREGVRRWAVLALARRMFDDARTRYEAQHQPAVVRHASTHLRRLTGDRYREVRMPLDGSDLQVLPAGDAPPKTVYQLSRGTAEQLYLALRFGFIEELTVHRNPLPIVIDDILVNFDPGRATASIETLVQLSERFQILYFTCHPETADRFQRIDSNIPAVQLCDGGFIA